MMSVQGEINFDIVAENKKDNRKILVWKKLYKFLKERSGPQVSCVQVRNY